VLFAGMSSHWQLFASASHLARVSAVITHEQFELLTRPKLGAEASGSLKAQSVHVNQLASDTFAIISVRNSRDSITAWLRSSEQQPSAAPVGPPLST
jgi:heme-degrading monooxygenase HmoA